MAKISSYPNVTPVLTDRILGSDVSDTGNDAGGETSNFLLSAVMTLFAANIALATSAITSGTFADARIAESNVTQHEAALTITESQISDLGSYLTSEANDLSAAVTWDDVPDANITESSVVQHEGAIDHDALTNFVANEHIDWTGDAGASNIHVNNITAVPEAAVTAHEAALTITESQISDLGTYIEATGVTFENLDANGDVGTGSAQVAAGDHNHTGTYQPLDAGLTSIAGLTTVADRMIYTTASDTYAVATLTSAARSILDDASTAAIRTTLGVGTGQSPQFTAINVGHASDTTLARSSAGNLTIEGNLIYRAGGTDVPVTDGGTGASTAGDARTNLGLVIGTDLGQQTLAVTPSADLNDWDPGLAVSKDVLTTIEVAPSSSIRITGIDDDGVEEGKFVRIWNTTDPDASTAYLIIIEWENTTDSASGHEFTWRSPVTPCFIMPGEFADFQRLNSKWRWAGGSRGNGAQWFDFNISRTHFGDLLANGGNGGANPDVLQLSATGLPTRLPGSRIHFDNASGSDFAVMGHGYGDSISPDEGAMLFSIILRPIALATASEDYIVWAGITNHYMSSYDYSAASAPDDVAIGVIYDRATSTSWQSITAEAGTSTRNSLVTASATAAHRFVCFLNGDGTRADFFYSTNMTSWTKGTSHDTNMATSDVSFGIVGAKLAGDSTDIDIYYAEDGFITPHGSVK